MQDAVSEIKSKLLIEDLVAPYVQLKKAGKYLKACCPFHQEKTPSFFVSPERQIAYCFSCQKGGDMFQFIQDIEGLEFRAALELLAEKANVDLPKYSGGGSKTSKDLKDRLKLANRDANNFFVQNLWQKGAAEKVLAYVKNRSFTDETIRFFQLGFAKEDKDSLYRHLLEKKHEKADILEATLVVARDSEAKTLYDRFKLRLMFPIDNSQGDIVAFGGRALRKGDKPKYLNSPEYALYHKGGLLYNLSRAKKSIREKDFTVVVEGYFDVMASHQAGVENVVASSGTALGDKQFKLLKRYSKKVALAFDSDQAGQDALLRAVYTAQELEIELSVVVIPEGKDAADAVKEDAKLWTDAVDARQPYLDFFFNQWQSEHDLSTSFGKRAFTDSALELLKGVKHPVERDHQLKELAKLVGTPLDLLYDYLNQISAQRKTRAVKEHDMSAKIQMNKKDRLILYFIGMLVAFPDKFFPLWEDCDNFKSFSEKAKELGMVRQMNRLDEDKFKTFYEDFENQLESESVSFDVSSVYKQVRDHYNLHAELDEVFYMNIEHGDELKRMAFAAELKNSNANLINQEFEKLLVLLYLEFTP